MGVQKVLKLLSITKPSGTYPIGDFNHIFDTQFSELLRNMQLNRIVFY